MRVRADAPAAGALAAAWSHSGAYRVAATLSLAPGTLRRTPGGRASVAAMPEPISLPQALQEARAARVGTLAPSPSRLYHLAVEELGVGDEATRRYRHAMIEAGYIVRKDNGQPYDPCPECNWSPNV